MATRRPKVPRATPAAPKSPETGDGGDVIQADFGSSRHAPSPAAQPHAPGSRPGASKPGASNPGPAHSGTASSGTAHSGTSGSGAARSGASKPGAGTSGASRSGTAKPGLMKPGLLRPGAPRSGTAAAGTAKQSGTGTAAGEENLDPVPAKAFSGRTLALFVVMIAITIMLAPTVKIFFEKRAEIAALEADISAKQDQQSDLRRQVSRWQDPNYVKQQARDRINMVMPGETGYWVFGSELPAGASSGAAGAGSQQDPADLPWVDSLWDSILRSATD
ncbi:MAG TPA: septum formation initiator family protein [Arthrobacter sp.]|nr:septum formation initiator family protein [Arthrobacter sp.]